MSCIQVYSSFLPVLWCPCIAINVVSVNFRGGFLPDIILLNFCYYHRGTPLNAMKRFLKKNQSTPRPSEHPPVMGENMSKRLGGIKGCKYKTSSWHLNRFPDADNIGSTV